jgi:hypothetical protein
MVCESPISPRAAHLQDRPSGLHWMLCMLIGRCLPETSPFGLLKSYYNHELFEKGKSSTIDERSLFFGQRFLPWTGNRGRGWSWLQPPPTNPISRDDFSSDAIFSKKGLGENFQTQYPKGLLTNTMK